MWKYLEGVYFNQCLWCIQSVSDPSLLSLPPRVVQSGSEKRIGSHVFKNWGSHSNIYPQTYFTAAAALGLEREEIDEFIHRLRKVFKKFHNRLKQPPEVIRMAAKEETSEVIKMAAKEETSEVIKMAAKEETSEVIKMAAKEETSEVIKMAAK